MLLVMEKSFYDQINREQGIIQKAVRNDAVFTLYTRYRRILPDANPDVVNDTILKLTRTYDPNKDFVEQFKTVYNELSQSFKRGNYYSQGYHTDIEDIPSPDPLQDEFETVEAYDINNDKVLRNAVVETAAKTTKSRKRRAKKA